MAELTDIPRLLRDLIDGLYRRQVLELAAQAQIRMMRERIRAWRTLTGSPMKPYSERHANKRVELGLSVRPMGPNTDSMLVMDSYSGMLSRIESDSPKPGEVTLDITNPVKRQIAAYHNLLGVGKKGANLRPFWGIAQQESAKLVELIGDNSQALLNDLINQYNAA